MANPTFRVEAIVPNLSAIFGRWVEDGVLRLTPQAKLGGYPVKWFDIPRKMLDDGTPDTGVICFILKNAERTPTTFRASRLARS